MGLRKFKPVTPGTRFRVGASFTEITATKPEKSLVVSSKKSGGRNNTGKMTMRYMGGGHKKSYRLIFWYKYSNKYVLACISRFINQFTKFVKNWLIFQNLLF